MRNFILIIVIVFAFDTNASESSQDNHNEDLKKTTWGIGLAGNAYVPSGSDNDDGESFVSFSIIHEHHYDNNFSFHKKLYIGNPDNLDLSGLQLSFKAKGSLVGNLAGFGRIGANYTSVSNKSISDDNLGGGLGYVWAAGLEYDMDNGIMISLELERYTGKKNGIELFGFNLTFGRSF